MLKGNAKRILKHIHLKISPRIEFHNFLRVIYSSVQIPLLSRISSLWLMEIIYLCIAHRSLYANL